MKKVATGCLLAAAVLVGSALARPGTPASCQGGSPCTQLGYEIVAEYPHDTRAFTQGLFWHAGHLYEGTGRRGTSELRQVEIASGSVLRSVPLDDSLFGEGIALLDDRSRTLHDMLSGTLAVRPSTPPGSASPGS